MIIDGVKQEADHVIATVT